MARLRLVGASGTEAVRRLRRQAPDSHIVLLTMSDNPLFARRTRGAGAIGFVLTEMADSDLSDAIRSAAAGRSTWSPRPPGPAELAGRFPAGRRVVSLAP